MESSSGGVFAADRCKNRTCSLASVCISFSCIWGGSSTGGNADSFSPIKLLRASNCRQEAHCSKCTSSSVVSTLKCEPATALARLPCGSAGSIGSTFSFFNSRYAANNACASVQFTRHQLLTYIVGGGLAPTLLAVALDWPQYNSRITNLLLI